MNIHLLKVRKLIISSMISLTGLLLMLFIISFLPNSSIDLKKIITFGVLLPLLLVVIISIAYFGKKFTTVQQSFISEDYDIIKGILGDEVRYHANGMNPFQVIETDPSVTAEQANSCKSTHMLSGTYRGIDFTATNLVTSQSRGYATVDHSIFDGYYKLHLDKVVGLLSK